MSTLSPSPRVAHFTPVTPGRVSPRRVVAVLLGLVAGGAVAGAVAGAVGATIWVTLVEGLGGVSYLDIWQVAGIFGAPFGAVLLPLAGFTALRRVPIGQILLFSTFSTALASAIGTTIHPPSWLVSAVAGFLLATAWLWRKARRQG